MLILFLDNNSAIGCFIGHTEELTYVDSKGDERYLCKPQIDHIKYSKHW